MTPTIIVGLVSTQPPATLPAGLPYTTYTYAAVKRNAYVDAIEPRQIAIKVPINTPLTDHVVRDRQTPYLEVHNQDGQRVLRGAYRGYSLSDGIIDLTYDAINVLPRAGNARRRYQYNCNHTLYARPGCGAGTQYHINRHTVTAVAGNRITIATLTRPDHYFAGGMIRVRFSRDEFWVDDHVGTVVTTYSTPTGIVVGSNAELTPGCDRTTTTCHNTFSNLRNFGGFPEFRGQLWDKPLINTTRGV